MPTEEVVNKIKELGEELEVGHVSGSTVLYRQFFNIKKIAAAAHEVGANAGFDLAHTTGNIPLNLHDDHVDFAVWCSYKYLNSGPGGTGGFFVHSDNANKNGHPQTIRMVGSQGRRTFQNGQ